MGAMRTDLPILVLSLCVAIAAAGVSLAQPAPAPAASQPAEGFVELNFPPNVELRVVLEYLSERLGLNLLYDEQVDGKKLTMTSPTRVPADRLPDLLRTILALKGFVLVDADVAGWQRVAAVGELPGEVIVEFIPMRHADAGALAEQLKPLVAARSRASGGPTTAPAGAAPVEVSSDPRTNQVVLIGPAVQVAETMEIVEELDVDVAAEQSPIRFYKLANATAAEVLDTIRSLEGRRNAPTPGVRGGGDGRSEREGRDRSSAVLPGSAGGTRQPGGRIGGASDGGGAFAGAGATRIAPAGSAARMAASAAEEERSPAGGTRGAAVPDFAPGALTTDGASAPDAGGLTSQPATVTADANTNTIIVVGGPSVQRVYEELIRQLDRRRPQVLIESTVVTLDTSRGFSLGVEIGANGGDETRRLLFSSFGISQVNPLNGQLTPTQGLGFTGALLKAGDADIVLRALATHSRARIVASPRILVNDNATGTLYSIAESPFTSVNANQSIATTSFAGYAEAGTELTLTPHISEADYLQLEYEVALSSFTGQGANGIPPPRQTDKVASSVTVPDGTTIVVGGLNRKQFRAAVNAVPILGQIPVLGNLFRSRTEDTSSTTLYVFIRPVILRDDQFADLKFMSERDVEAAGLPPEFPTSEPLEVR